MSIARLIDGKMIAESVRAEIAAGVAERRGRGLRAPGLAVVLVGENPASQSYVKSKSRAALEVGFHSVQRNLPVTVSEADLLAVVREFNDDSLIDGILVQLPLPAHISEQRVIETISPAKDVDGFHPESAGRLSLGLPGFVPCTPLGVKEMLLREKIETVGKVAVVIGRSNIVGKPMANLLWAKGMDATVTLAHSRTRDLAELCRRADILVAAIGKPRAITADMIKPGAVVIDVGINRIEDAGTKTGYRLVGDVDFDGAVKVAGAITPVPGGVGPMTIAMLMRNTFESAASLR